MDAGRSERNDPMKTYPDVDQRNGRQFAFEIENSYLGLRSIATVLSGVDGVANVEIRHPFARGWGENRARFKYQGRDFVVWEPHGDSSRYWIGPPREEDRGDVTPIERAFQIYQPPLLARIVGDILTLRMFKRFLGRA